MAVERYEKKIFAVRSANRIPTSRMTRKMNRMLRVTSKVGDGV
jgi:hypothetical protein